MPVAGEPWRTTPSRLAGRPSRARVTPSRWRMRVIETVRKGRPIAQQAMAGCQRARMARRSNAEIRMRRTNHYAGAALAATASKSPTTVLRVNKDPLGLLLGQDEASVGHLRASHGLNEMVHLIDGSRFSNRRFLGHPAHFPFVGDPVPATPFARIGFMNRDERRE